jgi:hypothetical protein
MVYRENAQDETKELADYLKGYGDAVQNAKISRAAEWMEKLSWNVCGQGYVGCSGGHDCGSDHK